MSKTRKKYTPEFKQEAVKLAEKVGFTKAGTDLGVHDDNIRRWAKVLKANKWNLHSPSRESEAEIRRLRKANSYLKKINNEVVKKHHCDFLKRPHWRFEMVECLSHEIPVVFLCRHFGVSTSGYYKWKVRPISSAKIRKQKACEKIKAIFADSKGNYGSPRIYKELKSQGVPISENTVARYMNEMGLDALKKNFHLATTNSTSHDGPRSCV